MKGSGSTFHHLSHLQGPCRAAQVYSSHTLQQAQTASLQPASLSVVVEKLNRSYASTFSQRVTNSQSTDSIVTWSDRSPEAVELLDEGQSTLEDQLPSQRLRNIWWHLDESPSPSVRYPEHTEFGTEADRSSEQLPLHQQRALAQRSYELSHTPSEVEAADELAYQACITASQSEQPSQQLDTVQEGADSNSQDGENSGGSDTQGDDAPPAPLFNNAFRDILAGALARQKAMMSEDMDDDIAYAASRPLTPPPIERSASEEALATALAVSKVTLARMMEVRKEIETAIARETKQVDRLAFALQKVRTDAAYYRTLEEMNATRKMKLDPDSQ
ncbi:MAG: hypothetical protein WDW38_003321 [Sanguina aurantia]